VARPLVGLRAGHDELLAGNVAAFYESLDKRSRLAAALRDLIAQRKATREAITMTLARFPGAPLPEHLLARFRSPS
jgi:hypothetical protein